jgi:hypothetical protein
MLPFNVYAVFVPLNTITQPCYRQVGPIHVYTLTGIFRQTHLCGQPFNWVRIHCSRRKDYLALPAAGFIPHTTDPSDRTPFRLRRLSGTSEVHPSLKAGHVWWKVFTMVVCFSFHSSHHSLYTCLFITTVSSYFLIAPPSFPPAPPFLFLILFFPSLNFLHVLR